MSNNGHSSQSYIPYTTSDISAPDITQYFLTQIRRLRKRTCNEDHKFIQQILAAYFLSLGHKVQLEQDLNIEGRRSAGTLDVYVDDMWGIEVDSYSPGSAEIKRKTRIYSPHVEKFSFAFPAGMGNNFGGTIERVLGEVNAENGKYRIDSFLTVQLEPPFEIIEHLPYNSKWHPSGEYLRMLTPIVNYGIEEGQGLRPQRNGRAYKISRR